MELHLYVYVALAVAYCEAAGQSVAEKKYHYACREAVIALLYATLPLLILDPRALPISVGAA